MTDKIQVREKPRSKPKTQKTVDNVLHITNAHHLSRFLYPNPVCILSTLTVIPPNELTNPNIPSHWKKKQFIRNMMIITWLTPINNNGHFICSLNKSRFTAHFFLHNHKKFILNIPVAGQEELLNHIGRVHGSKIDKFESLEILPCYPGWETPASLGRFESDRWAMLSYGNEKEEIEQLEEVSLEKGFDYLKRDPNQKIDSSHNQNDNSNNLNNNNNNFNNNKNNNNNNNNNNSNNNKNNSHIDMDNNNDMNGISANQNQEKKILNEEFPPNERDLRFNPTNNLIAVMSSCCHLVCEVLDMGSFSCDSDHHLLTCKISEAFVKKEYWSGNNFICGPKSPPYLTFLGSARFGQVIPSDIPK